MKEQHNIRKELKKMFGRQKPSSANTHPLLSVRRDFKVRLVDSFLLVDPADKSRPTQSTRASFSTGNRWLQPNNRVQYD